MDNFILVLFKNNKKKRIIKGYATEKNAVTKYNKLIEENKNIDFEVLYENGELVKYELALLSNVDNYQIPLYKTDEIGRSNSVFMSDNSNYTIKKIDNFKKKELIYDWQTKGKVSLSDIIKKYCDKKNLKLISLLNNKVIIQVDDIFNLFSLKNPEDGMRFFQYLEKYFILEGRSDAIFVKDSSPTQKKWLYDLLEKRGFSKESLYRQYTTFPSKK